MSDSRPAMDRNTLLVLLLITGIGLALRVYSLRQSLWLDELHTSWVIQDGGTLISRARLGNNSPVYFFLVRMATQLFGESEWSLRIPSVIAGTILIPGTFLVCRQWNCAVVSSLLAAALVAVDGNAHFFGTEARTYGIVQCVGLAHLWLFGRLLRTDDKIFTWAGWVLSGVLLFHLHCTSALVVLSEVIAYIILRWLRQTMKCQVGFLIAGFAVIGVGMFAGYTLLQLLAERRSNWSHFVPITGDPLRMLTHYPLWLYVLLPSVGGAVMKVTEWVLGKIGVSEEEPVPSWSLLIPFVLAGSWFLIPVVSAWVLTELDWARLFLRRYVIASSVALAPLAAMSVSAWTANRPRQMNILSWVVFVVAAIWISPNLSPRNEGWREAVQAINESSTARPVVLYSGLIETDGWFSTDEPAKRAYCENPLRGIYAVAEERQVVILPRTLSRLKTLELPQDVTEAWLLYRPPPRRIKEKVEPTTLDRLNSVAGQPNLSGQGGWKTKSRSKYGRMVLISLRRE